MLQQSQYATRTKPLLDKIDREHERKVAQKVIKPRPDEVSVESSRRQVFETSSSPQPDADRDVFEDLKQDLVGRNCSRSNNCN